MLQKGHFHGLLHSPWIFMPTGILLDYMLHAYDEGKVCAACCRPAGADFSAGRGQATLLAGAGAVRLC
jgi:hypothetical protein